MKYFITKSKLNKYTLLFKNDTALFLKLCLEADI